MNDAEISHEDLATAARVMRIMNERVIARVQSEQGAEWGLDAPRGTLDPDRRAAPCDRRAEDRGQDRRAA
jgi:hypothetical protein